MKRETKQLPFTQWLGKEIDRRGIRREVDETLAGMRVEQRLVQLREQRGLTQRQLAHRLGVSQPVIARIETGKVKNLTLKTLARLASALRARVEIGFPADSARGAARARALSSLPGALRLPGNKGRRLSFARVRVTAAKAARHRGR